MLKKNVHYCLCSNCNNFYTCIYIHNTDVVIYQCEEYIETTAREPCESENYLEKSGSTKLSSVPEYKGLCINCENRETCNLAATKGGVWHCEEYR